MPRDSSGNYTLPSGNPVTTDTTISSTVHNATLNDIKAELTDSLSRSGKGSMQVPMTFGDGTQAAPGIAFGSETGSGLYRAGAGDVRLTRLGADRIKISSTRVGFVGGGAGQQVSTSSGAFSTSSASYVDVTNLTVTITTTGRPVLIATIPDPAANTSYFGLQSDGTVRSGFLQILRGVTVIGGVEFNSDVNMTIKHPPGLLLLDVVVAGTYVYKVQGSVSNAAATLSVNYLTLLAYEL